MTLETNPYQAPLQGEARSLRLRFLRMLSNAGLILQAIVLATYMLISFVDSDRPPSVIIASLDPKFHATMAFFSILGGVFSFYSSATRIGWSIYVRVALASLALLIFGFTVHASHMFGLLK